MLWLGLRGLCARVRVCTFIWYMHACFRQAFHCRWLSVARHLLTSVPACRRLTQTRCVALQMPIDVLKRMVRDVSAVPGVSRVLYDLTAKPPGTTEWE